MVGYCTDCKQEVTVDVFRDWIGDFDVIGGTMEITIWRCIECGGENVTEEKQDADPNEETGVLPERTNRAPR